MFKGEVFIFSKVLMLLVSLLLFLQIFNVDTRLGIDHRASVILTVFILLLAILLKNKGRQNDERI